MALEHFVSNFMHAFFQLIGLLILSGQNSIKSDYFEEDNISQMPDEMLALILSHLTFKDAVKARVLGRRWRHLHLSHLYSSRSELNFDYAWAGIALPPLGQSCLCEEYAPAFVQDVNEFLNQYKGPYISSFAVVFGLSRNFSSDIDRWITYAVKLGVEQLILRFKCSGISVCNQHQRYSFSFLHLSKAYELKRLELNKCILKPDFDGQFHSLKFLKLTDIPLNQSILQYILSRFVSLEELSMRFCMCPTVLSFRAPLLRLKTLSLYYCPKLEEIDLSATSLTTLHVTSAVVNFNIVFSSAPNLENLFLNKLYIARFPADLFNMIEDAALQLQSLLMVSDIIMVETIPSSIPTFHNLKHLELVLHASISPYDIRKIIPLIVACPLLEIFTFTIMQLGPYLGMASHIERRTMRDIPECRLPHLKEVELLGFQATGTQLELALYLLRNGVALERMVITPCRKYFYEHGQVVYDKYPGDKYTSEPWTDSMRRRIVERLQGEAASERVELSIYDC